MDIKRLNPTPRWSDATVFNGIAHFVEVPNDTSADMASQIRQILQQAEHTLGKLSSDKSRVLSATIYLAVPPRGPALKRNWWTRRCWWKSPLSLPRVERFSISLLYSLDYLAANRV
jgi:enamine deaminase RidA (YjgF/YER057c/UK114 family)